MATVRFDEVNDNTQRVVPAIFSNLRDELDLVERDRLRGAFKFAWSKNASMLAALRPVFDSLAANGVEFRVIKGVAVQAVCGRLGARVMGDVDLLVHDRDIAAVESAFSDHGFRRNTDLTCPGHSDASHFDSLNFNRESTHADVHIAEVKRPTRLFEAMLAEPGSRVSVAGTTVTVPPVDLLILHAACHGALAAGPTDVMQAALDLSLLRGMVDSEQIRQSAVRTGTLIDLLRLDRQLAAIHVPGAGVRANFTSSVASEVRRMQSQLGSFVVDVVPLIRRIRARDPGREVTHVVRRSFPGRRLQYRAWLRLGKFSATERMVVRRWGGFVEDPPDEVELGRDLHPFESVERGVVVSPVAQIALDWRFRIRVPKNSHFVWLDFDSPTLDRLDPLVYVNGVPVTRLVAGDTKSRRIGLRDVGPTIEVSVRPLGAACRRCFSGLDDIGVRVDVSEV